MMNLKHGHATFNGKRPHPFLKSVSWAVREI